MLVVGSGRCELDAVTDALTMSPVEPPRPSSKATKAIAAVAAIPRAPMAVQKTSDENSLRMMLHLATLQGLASPFSDYRR